MKKIIIGICIALMLIIPSVVGAIELKSVGFEFQNIDEGKPDLIIEKIVLKQSSVYPYSTDISVVVKNIGDATVIGRIHVEGLLRFYMLGFIPSRPIYFLHGNKIPSDGLEPGETVKINFGDDSEMRFFGWFKFEFEVNPFFYIDEENYSNNFYNERYFKIFSFWFLL